MAISEKEKTKLRVGPTGAPYRVFSSKTDFVEYQPGTNLWRVYTNRAPNEPSLACYPRFGNSDVGAEWIIRQYMPTITQYRIEKGLQKSQRPRPVNNYDISRGTQYKPEGMCSPLSHVLGYSINEHLAFIELKKDDSSIGHLIHFFEESGGLCRQSAYSRITEQRLGEASEKEDGGNWDYYAVKESKGGFAGMVDFLVRAEGKTLRDVGAILKAVGIINAGIKRVDLIEVHQKQTRRAESCGANYYKAENILERARETLILSDAPIRGLSRVMKPFRDELRDLGEPNDPKGTIAYVGEIQCLVDADNAACDIIGETTRQGFTPEMIMSLGEYSSRFKLTPFRIMMFIFQQLVGEWKPAKRKELERLAAMGGLRRDGGGNSLQTVAGRQKVKLGLIKADGIIIVQPFTCLPEIVAANVMSRSKDGIPCMTIGVDEHTGTAGMKTRAEAFTDMIALKKGSRRKRTY